MRSVLSSQLRELQAEAAPREQKIKEFKEQVRERAGPRSDGSLTAL
jgi:hypothetical protein